MELRTEGNMVEAKIKGGANGKDTVTFRSALSQDNPTVNFKFNLAGALQNSNKSNLKPPLDTGLKATTATTATNEITFTSPSPRSNTNTNNTSSRAGTGPGMSNNSNFKNSNGSNVNKTSGGFTLDMKNATRNSSKSFSPNTGSCSGLTPTTYVGTSPNNMPVQNNNYMQNTSSWGSTSNVTSGAASAIGNNFSSYFPSFAEFLTGSQNRGNSNSNGPSPSTITNEYERTPIQSMSNMNSSSLDPAVSVFGLNSSYNDSSNYGSDKKVKWYDRSNNSESAHPNSAHKDSVFTNQERRTIDDMVDQARRAKLLNETAYVEDPYYQLHGRMPSFDDGDINKTRAFNSFASSNNSKDRSNSTPPCQFNRHDSSGGSVQATVPNGASTKDQSELTGQGNSNKASNLSSPYYSTSGNTNAATGSSSTSSSRNSSSMCIPVDKIKLRFSKKGNKENLSFEKTSQSGTVSNGKIPVTSSTLNSNRIGDGSGSGEVNDNGSNNSTNKVSNSGASNNLNQAGTGSSGTSANLKTTNTNTNSSNSNLNKSKPQQAERKPSRNKILPGCGSSTTPVFGTESDGDSTSDTSDSTDDNNDVKISNNGNNSIKLKANSRVGPGSTDQTGSKNVNTATNGDTVNASNTSQESNLHNNLGPNQNLNDMTNMSNPGSQHQHQIAPSESSESGTQSQLPLLENHVPHPNGPKKSVSFNSDKLNSNSGGGLCEKGNDGSTKNKSYNRSLRSINKNLCIKLGEYMSKSINVFSDLQQFFPYDVDTLRKRYDLIRYLKFLLHRNRENNFKFLDENDITVNANINNSIVPIEIEIPNGNDRSNACHFTIPAKQFNKITRLQLMLSNEWFNFVFGILVIMHTIFFFLQKDLNHERLRFSSQKYDNSGELSSVLTDKEVLMSVIALVFVLLFSFELYARFQGLGKKRFCAALNVHLLDIGTLVVIYANDVALPILKEHDESNSIWGNRNNLDDHTSPDVADFLHVLRTLCAARVFTLLDPWYQALKLVLVACIPVFMLWSTIVALTVCVVVIAYDAKTSAGVISRTFSTLLLNGVGQQFNSSSNHVTQSNTNTVTDSDSEQSSTTDTSFSVTAGYAGVFGWIFGILAFQVLTAVLVDSVLKYRYNKVGPNVNNMKVHSLSNVENDDLNYDEIFDAYDDLENSKNLGKFKTCSNTKSAAVDNVNHNDIIENLDTVAYDNSDSESEDCTLVLLKSKRQQQIKNDRKIVQDAEVLRSEVELVLETVAVQKYDNKILNDPNSTKTNLISNIATSSESKIMHETNTNSNIKENLPAQAKPTPPPLAAAAVATTISPQQLDTKSIIREVRLEIFETEWYHVPSLVNMVKTLGWEVPGPKRKRIVITKPTEEIFTPRTNHDGTLAGNDTPSSLKGYQNQIREVGKDLFQMFCAVDNSNHSGVANTVTVKNLNSTFNTGHVTNSTNYVLSEWAFVDSYLYLRDLLNKSQNVARLRLCKTREEAVLRVRRKMGKFESVNGTNHNLGSGSNSNSAADPEIVNRKATDRPSALNSTKI